MPSYVITGANRGIGLAFVQNLGADSRNQVFAVVRNKPGATALLEFQSTHPNVHVYQADIIDVKSLKLAAEGMAKVTGGTLDVLINNAALIEESSMASNLTNYDGKEDVLEKLLAESFHVNTIGPIHTSNVFLPLIRKGDLKKIILISTGLADLKATLSVEIDGSAPYSISKAAANMAFAKYAAAVKKEGIVVLSISPGLVNTQQSIPPPEVLAEFAKMIAKFKTLAPEWDGQPITPEQSVEMVLKVIQDATLDQTGGFVSHHGNQEWL
ncbi:NAD(P)-binding protein [Sistotremastrum niveocremeum HHB9708]|uniref:NAD(P)-binding protein n=1 Tax=Sistotremastrum niveocremeum HHB9708 TaxID=1314777 RepID=A0A164VSQ5_9AGAM|nr:NAD(P)-binding protein [Sistotremastrum niveocremeum HHB9708]